MSRNSFHLRVKQAGKMAAGRKRPILTFVTCISLDMCDENAAHYNSMSNVQPMKITIFSHKFLREQDRARGSTTGRTQTFIYVPPLYSCKISDSALLLLLRKLSWNVSIWESNNLFRQIKLECNMTFGTFSKRSFQVEILLNR